MVTAFAAYRVESAACPGRDFHRQNSHSGEETDEGVGGGPR